MGSAAAAWLVANAVALLLLAVVLGGWARARADVRRAIIAALLCGGIAVAGVLLFTPTPIPIGWVTVLHEGRSAANVRQLYGQTAHAGIGFHYLVDLVTRRDLTTLPAVVKLNLCLAAANTIIFAALAGARLSSRWGGLVFGALYLANINTIHAAFSETPAMAWTTLFWLGCVAAAAIADRDHTTPRLRRLAVALLALIAGLAALLRGELLVIGAPAVAVAVAKEWGVEAAIRRGAARAWTLVRGLLAGPLWVLLAAVAAGLAIAFVPWLGAVSYLIDGLAPLNLSFLLLPQKLGMFLPVAVIALFILGVIDTTRRCLQFFLLPIAVLSLAKVYASATQGVLESFRYLTFLTPPVFLLAVFGVDALAELARRQAWPSWWRRAAILLAALSVSAWQPLGPREIFGLRQHLPGLATPIPLLARNQQSEVRYLLDLVGRHPECTFLIRTPDIGRVSDGPRGYRWSAFGGGVPSTETSDRGQSAGEAAAALAPDATCVLFYRSLDCNLVGVDDCRGVVGDTALEERVLPNLPYSDVLSYGEHVPEIRLAAYPVVPPAPPVAAQSPSRPRDGTAPAVAR